ncbi:MAG: MATE family efflux transporter, partial [Erysipelotrichaceae bacterium]|nr:MATE family efflux transporter [Erysipelotrichaceae bacterium]
MEENKLKTMPIARLLADMSLPMMVSFFIQALYNIVDSMFVAGISEDALTAVSLAFPMQQIANAIAVGIGVGISALVPRFAAVNDLKTANDCAHTGIFLNLVFFALFLLLGVSAVS